MTDDGLIADLPDLAGFTLRQVRDLDPDSNPLLLAALDRIKRDALRSSHVEQCVRPPRS